MIKYESAFLVIITKNEWGQALLFAFPTVLVAVLHLSRVVVVKQLDMTELRSKLSFLSGCM